MKIKKDDIKTVIVVVCVCLICVVGVLIINRKSNFDKLEVVDEYNVFFSNVSYINEYVSYVSNKNVNVLYSLLDSDYIENNDITTDNIMNKIEYYPVGSYFSANSMSFVQIKDSFLFYITGVINYSEHDSDKIIDDNFSVLLFIDYINSTFSIYPNPNGYKKIVNRIKKINIVDNGYNVINASELISKEYICSLYLSDFANKFVKNLDGSYDLLSDKMKSIYPDVSSYKQYVIDNTDVLFARADKCKLEEVDEKRVYTVIDINENKYVFTEDSVMNYKVDFYLKKVRFFVK